MAFREKCKSISSYTGTQRLVKTSIKHNRATTLHDPVSALPLTSFSSKLHQIKSEFSQQLQENNNYLSTLLITLKDLREEKNKEKLRTLHKVQQELDEIQGF